MRLPGGLGCAPGVEAHPDPSEREARRAEGALSSPRRGATEAGRRFSSQPARGLVLRHAFWAAGLYDPGPGDSALSEGGLVMVPGPWPPKATVGGRLPRPKSPGLYLRGWRRLGAGSGLRLQRTVMQSWGLAASGSRGSEAQGLRG